MSVFTAMSIGFERRYLRDSVKDLRRQGRFVHVGQKTMNDRRESAFGLEDFFRVRFGFGLGNHLFNHPLFINDKRSAVRAIVFTPHEFFQSPHAIGVVDMQFLVGADNLSIDFTGANSGSSAEPAVPVLSRT